MIKVEIEGFEDLIKFIELFRDLDEKRVKHFIDSLTRSTNALNEAEKKESEQDGTR